MTNDIKIMLNFWFCSAPLQEDLLFFLKFLLTTCAAAYVLSTVFLVILSDVIFFIQETW